MCTKLQHHIRFPLHINMSSYISSLNTSNTNNKKKRNINNSCNYILTSIIVHLGYSIHNGHYITYFRKNDQWFYANDIEIKQVSINEVLHQSAFLLFYENVKTLQNIQTYSYTSNYPIHHINPLVRLSNQSNYDSIKRRKIEVYSNDINHSSEYINRNEFNESNHQIISKSLNIMNMNPLGKIPLQIDFKSYMKHGNIPDLIKVSYY